MGKRTIVGERMKNEGGLAAQASDERKNSRFVLLRHTASPDDGELSFHHSSETAHLDLPFGATSVVGVDASQPIEQQTDAVARGTFPHWDLMLEPDDLLHNCEAEVDAERDDKKLFTLQLTKLPIPLADGAQQVLQAKRIADHRALYLDYEGEISGNRGFVKRLAEGTYQCEQFGHETKIRLNLKPANKMHDVSEALSTELHLECCPVGAETMITVISWTLT